MSESEIPVALKRRRVFQSDRRRDGERRSNRITVRLSDEQGGDGDLLIGA